MGLKEEKGGGERERDRQMDRRAEGHTDREIERQIH